MKKIYSAVAVAATAASAVILAKYKSSAPSWYTKMEGTDKLERDERKEMLRVVPSRFEEENGQLVGISCDVSRAISHSRDLCQKLKDELGAPGLVVAVSVHGKRLWQEGVGFSDVENRVHCHPDTVMRIASVSKPITMAVVGKLWEEGKLDLDKPIQEYVPNFPKKTYQGKEVQISTRMLISHMAGIRHYDKKEVEGKPKQQQVTVSEGEGREEKRSSNKADSAFKEFFIKEKFTSVEKALELFKDDDLTSMPGTHFLYSTHGWTLVSAVVEGVTKVPFAKYMQGVFHQLGLINTYLDENEPLIYNRARYYVKNDKGRLVNAPYVDNSYKWAGGGFLSTVGDMTKFGNAMLYSFQHQTTSREPSNVSKTLQGYLKPTTVEAMWTPVSKTQMTWDKNGAYGMGWGVMPFQHTCQFCRNQEFYVSHTGGAMGASSVLLVLPTESQDSVPSGVVVAMITNLQGVNMNKTALEIARAFASVEK